LKAGLLTAMKNNKKPNMIIKCALIALCSIAVNVHSDLVIVVAADSPVTELSKKQVSKIFLGKSRRFPDGSRAVPLNQSEGNAERDTFYQRVSGKSPAQVKAHWSKLIFTGRGQPPKEAADSAAVKYLLTNNGVNIAYLDSSEMDNTIKIVAVK